MKIPRWTLAAKVAIAVVLAPPRMLVAQGVTTGSMTGVITSAGAPVPSATVIAVHVTSGTRYATFTRADGHYFIANNETADIQT